MPRPYLDVVRTEVNLFKRDKEAMIKHYGQGWTTIIRELVEDHCSLLRVAGSMDTTKRPKMEDFDE